MHELSIATALCDQVRRHTPAGSTATRIRIEAGPLQSIDPDALAFAWQSITDKTDLAASQLEITIHPWQLTCEKCRRAWTSPDMFDPCTCGNEVTTPIGSNELRLVSLDVEPAAETPARN